MTEQTEPLSEARLTEIKRYIEAEYPYEAISDEPWGGWAYEGDYMLCQAVAEVERLRAARAVREEMDKIVRDWLIDNPPIPGAEISDAAALDAYHAMRRLATRLAAADGASGVR